MFPLQRRDEVNLARQGLYPGFLRSILRQKEATPPFALLLQDDLTGEVKYHDADSLGPRGVMHMQCPITRFEALR
jgi:hypothetical protein